MGFDKMQSCGLALHTSQSAAFFSVILDMSQRVVLGLQTWVVVFTCRRIGIINFWSVDFLECFHGADGADELKARIITQQITVKIERQWCHAISGHEITYFEAHFRKILVSQRRITVLKFHTEYGVLIICAMVGLAG